MAIDSAAKRASALGTYTYPYLRLVVPDGSVDRAASLGLYSGIASGADVSPPTVGSATINTAGTTITISLNEPVTFGAGGNGGFTLTLTGGAVTATYSSGSGSSLLVYSLSRTVEYDETGTHAYTQPGNGVEDLAGNDLATYSGATITNNSTEGQDLTAPTLSSATIGSSGTSITLAFSESVLVGIGGNAGFTLSLSGGSATLSYASGSGSSSLVYNISRTIYSGETGTISYTQPGSGIEDAAGNDLASFSNSSITNNSSQVPDTTEPTVSSRTIATNGNSITIGLSESVSFGGGGNGGFALTPTNGGSSVTLTYSSGTGTSSLVYTTSRTISDTETLTLSYTQPGNGVQDAAGNDLVTFSGQAVTNSSTVNNDPTDISLSRQTVRVSAGLNATVGTISSTDPDAGDTFTYSLVSGIGSTDNAEFSISGNILRADDPAALGVGTRSVRIRTTDSQANTFEKAFTITVLEASSNSFDFIQKTQFIGWMQ